MTGIDVLDLRVKYAGAIGLLCECAVYLGNGAHKEELRDMIEQAAKDFCAINPGWQYRRVVHRIEMIPPEVRPVTEV